MSVSSIVETLVKKYNCIGIKTSFEDEGVHFKNAIKLRYITSKLNIKFAIKIGGPEAKTNFLDAVDLCADCIVAPMVESGYAAKKFTDMSSMYNCKKGLNIETINALNVIDDILSFSSDVDYFVIGRSDLACSMNLDKSSVDSDDVYYVVESALKKIKNQGKPTYMGGSLTCKSKDFVKRLFLDGLLDYVETRHVILKLDQNFIDNDFEDAIKLSLKFENEWNKECLEKTKRVSFDFENRISSIEKRLCS